MEFSNKNTGIIMLAIGIFMLVFGLIQLKNINKTPFTFIFGVLGGILLINFGIEKYKLPD